MLPQAEKRKASRPSSGFLKEHETPSDHILESAFNHSNQKVFSRLQITKGGPSARRPRRKARDRWCAARAAQLLVQCITKLSRYR
jgi:hypothetical protein